jgi:c-di-GMP-binding flagellar brake protein YcgR
VPVAAPGTRLSVEVLTNGNLLWFYTTLHSIAGAALDRLLIHAPAGVETVQRRRYPRVDLQVPVHLVLERTGQPISMAFRDLSAGGGALISKIPVAAGERVLLVFDLGSGLCFQDLGAEVVRCTDGPEGRYVVALRFVCEKDQEQALAAWVNAKLANQ